MTELIVIIVIIVFVLVLLDGLRRNFGERRKRVVLKLDKNSSRADLSDDDLFVAELPNGGARTVPRAGESVPRTVKPASKLKTGIPSKARLQPRDVPVLIDAVELEEEDIEHTNVFADSSSTPAGESEDYESEDRMEEESAMGVYAEIDAEIDAEEVDEFIDGLDEDENLPAARSRARTQSGGDEDEWEDEWEEDDDDEEEDDGEVWEEGWEDDEVDDVEADDRDDDDEEDEEDEEDDDEDEEDFPDSFPDDVDEDAYNKLGIVERRQEKAAVPAPALQGKPSAGRIEPGFGDDELDTYEIEDNFEAPFGAEKSEVLARSTRAGAADKSASHASPENRPGFAAGFLSKKDQGELFREEVKEPTAASQDSGPQEVIVINVMARPGSVFEGYELLPILQLQGMRLGDMSIFHKHSGSNASGIVQFSMANMVKPGTFNLASMETFTTPGVSFFLQLPNKYGNMACFDQMLTAANALKHSLNGELKDENRSVFTRQTMEHYRQRIRDFELKLLSRK